MSLMFKNCSSLKNINLSNFNTNKVNDISYMFYECSSLINIDLSNFNANKVTDISYIFYGCKKLNKNNVIVNDQNILKKL